MNDKGDYMEERVIKGDKFIEIGIRESCSANNLDYNEDFEVSHINYDKDINKNFQYKIIREITHDGTLIFTKYAIVEIFYELAEGKTVYKPLVDNVDLSNVIGVNYTIGDLKIKSEKVSKVSDNKRFPGVREVFELPIHCELIK